MITFCRNTRESIPKSNFCSAVYLRILCACYVHVVSELYTLAYVFLANLVCVQIVMLACLFWFYFTSLWKWSSAKNESRCKNGG